MKKPPFSDGRGPRLGRVAHSPTLAMFVAAADAALKAECDGGGGGGKKKLCRI